MAGIGNGLMKMMGFSFVHDEPKYAEEEKVISKDAISFIDKDSESTAAVVSSAYTSGIYLDMMGNIKAEADLVTKYREMSSHPEVDNAVDEITNECITTEDDFIVKLDLTKVEMLDDQSKLVLQHEHDSIMDIQTMVC
jgi:hypothetical protein